MNKALGSIWYWKAGIARAVLYALLSGGLAFESATSGMSDEQWVNLSSLRMILLALKVSGAVTVVLIAYLDKAMALLKSEGRSQKEETGKQAL